MKWSLNEIKGKVVEKTKEYAAQYYKIAGSVAVVASLCVICIVTLVGRINEKNAASGVMMTLSDVAKEQEPFAGNTFVVSGITYESMVNVTYETDQLAQLEKTEKQIDEILSAKKQDKKDQAALDALTAQHQTHTAIGLYDPNDQVVVVTAPEDATAGTTPAAVVTYADENGTYEEVGQFTLTAYCPCPICCGAYSNMENPTTSSGTRATAGRTIAADTSVFPFGTRLKINGQIYTVEDTGGAIRGNRIDIFFNTHEEALQFGRQVATVYRVVE